jgi:hypothetical protein
MKYVLLLTPLLAMAGCSVLDNGMKAQIAGANIEIAKARAVASEKPLLDVVIPVPNCTPVPIPKDATDPCAIKIVVRMPPSGNNGQIAMPDDPWARVAERFVGGLVTVGGLFVGGEAAENLVRASSEGIVSALKVQPAPTVVVTEAVVSVPPEIVHPEVVNPVIVPQEVIQVPTQLINYPVFQ